MTRHEIVEAFKQATAESGGKPLGRARFEQLTGITEYDVGRYWATFGGLQREAGFAPNTLNAAYDFEHLAEHFARLTRALGHAPTAAELRIARHSDPTFPSLKVFERIGAKNERITKMLAYCQGRPEHADVAAILEQAHQPAGSEPVLGPAEKDSPYGFVYLVRGHPAEYKIGRTNLVDRRLSEIGVTAAVEHTLIHEIKTDDPAGVEAYWHDRFKNRHMRGEWFKLTSADVRTFKRWKRIY